MKKMKKWSTNMQAGWTTMEYVVGAIALVGVVIAVLSVFKDKLITAIQSLTLI